MAVAEITSTFPVGHGLCHELVATTAQLRQLATDALDVAQLPPEWTKELTDLTAACCEREAKAASAAKSSCQTSWRTWIDKAIAEGKKSIHNLLRPRHLWIPTTVVVDGVLDASPLAILQNEADVLADLWDAAPPPKHIAHQDADQYDGPSGPINREACELAEPHAIAAAALSFPAASGLAADGFHPRQFAMLSRDGLCTISLLFLAMESVGHLPEQIITIIFVLLPKLTGGVRPIALFASLYRLWTRTRRPLVQQWMQSNNRPFFAAGKGRDPESTVWRQAMRAETAVANTGPLLPYFGT